MDIYLSNYHRKLYILHCNVLYELKHAVFSDDVDIASKSIHIEAFFFIMIANIGYVVFIDILMIICLHPISKSLDKYLFQLFMRLNFNVNVLISSDS